jgi:glycosyltransferase involved in cell wall biosynthesis
MKVDRTFDPEQPGPSSSRLRAMNPGEPQQVPPLVLQVSPGGLEYAGGIGRMIGYMIDAWSNKRTHPDMRVLDSRGPGHILLSPWHFARCLLTVAIMAPQHPLLHVHVAGRGSTIRKIILVHFARLLRLPIVLHLHDYNYRESLQRFPKLIQLAARSMFRISSMILVLGQDDHDLVVTEIGVSPDRVAVIPNAVPAPPQKRQAAASTPPVQILFLGNPSRRKGLHDLIAALAMNPLRSLEWRMSVAGGGNDIGTFRELSRAAGLSDRISFTGWVDRSKTDALLNSADIIVLPSYAEGMAMSILEGMSYGLCIVCTPVGSLKEVIEDEVTGLVVQPGDITQLSKALTRAVSDPALRVQLGSEAARTFSNKFDSAHYPDRMGAIYHAALAATSGI